MRVSETFKSIVIDTLRVINDEHRFNASSNINIVDKLEKNKEVYHFFKLMAKQDQKGNESRLDYAYRLIK